MSVNLYLFFMAVAGLEFIGLFIYTGKWQFAALVIFQMVLIPVTMAIKIRRERWKI